MGKLKRLTVSRICKRRSVEVSRGREESKRTSRAGEGDGHTICSSYWGSQRLDRFNTVTTQDCNLAGPVRHAEQHQAVFGTGGVKPACSEMARFLSRLAATTSGLTVRRRNSSGTGLGYEKRARDCGVKGRLTRHMAHRGPKSVVSG